jgi:hypothetical protein
MVIVTARTVARGRAKVASLGVANMISSTMSFRVADVSNRYLAIWTILPRMSKKRESIREKV